MSKTSVMSRIRRKLTMLIDLENTHCGHDSRIVKADECRFELEKMIEQALEEASKGVSNQMSSGHGGHL